MGELVALVVVEECYQHVQERKILPCDFTDLLLTFSKCVLLFPTLLVRQWLSFHSWVWKSAVVLAFLMRTNNFKC